jgi:hypothetical protein
MLVARGAVDETARSATRTIGLKRSEPVTPIADPDEVGRGLKSQADSPPGAQTSLFVAPAEYFTEWQQPYSPPL